MSVEDLILKQHELDVAKYYKGMEIEADPSGKMDYCVGCAQCKEGCCSASQEVRVADAVCAKAYFAKDKKPAKKKAPSKKKK